MMLLVQLKIAAADSSVHIPTLFGLPICINLPAIVIVLLITMILVKGTKDSTKMAGLWYL